ncbi:MAG TPA: diaminopimelate epimerase [Thiobacillaceae bacterium]|nr:diaminopimelate epimerase [Thiobacillaceae bacterium]HNU65413.1 diaminopimelate epimerase [Thiobacillaceae bacterium]
MKLKFTKMHGAGNDFVVFDGIRQQVGLTAEQCRAIADRHFGVGCDQILLVQRPGRADADFRYRIFNADGSEVQQCGNGARCFVRFVHDKGLTRETEIRVETASGIIVPRLEADGQVTVDMGPPRFAPADIPFLAETRAPTYVIDVDGPQGVERVEISALSMGNPHAVRVVCNLDAAPVRELGALLERHPRFPERVNVGFMQVLHRREVRLRVYERGSGETLACGTGACAAVVAGISRGLLDPTVTVHTLGGDLDIHWAGDGHAVFLTGPAVTVFEGEIEV